MRKIAVWALLAMGCLTAAARDRDDASSHLPPLLPEPQALQAAVPRGGPVWITLNAYSLTSPIIRYRIHRQPEGQIGAPELLPDGRARVRYQPPAGGGPGVDSFTYEVQSEAGVSAPAEVRVKLTDTDPQLTAPTELDFGHILPGESARRTLILQNIGGGIAEGNVRLPEGWSLEGDPAYRIAGGEKQSFTLIFTPTEQRQYLGDVEFTSNLELATDLVGKEIAPIAISGGPVELSQTGSIRMGVIEVENHTATAQSLHVVPGPHLDADATVIVPASGVAQIIVRASAREKGAIQDQVTITGSGLNAAVPIHAAPLQDWAGNRPATASMSSTAAIVSTPPPPIFTISAPASASAQSDVSLPQAPGNGADALDLQFLLSLRPLSVAKVGFDNAEITCDFSKAPPARSYRVESQSVTINGRGHAEADWTPMDDTFIQLDGAKVTAKLTHLSRGTLYVVRIVGTGATGNAVSSSTAGQVWTRKPSRPAYTRWLLLGVAIIAGIVFWRRRNRAAIG